MNLVIVSVLLLAMLAFQPTLIYGTKSLASAGNSSNRNLRANKYSKRHTATAALSSSHTPTLTSTAKLVLSLESGKILVRPARGANAETINGGGGNGGGGNKRQKNNNNKKLNNKKSSHENASPTSMLSSSIPSSSTGRKSSENIYSAVVASTAANQKTQFNSNGSGNNNKGKTRQLLKSQKHQNHATTCRYAKSAWSDCDPQTNLRTRTLTLKKGDPNCLQTRTMEKKCKKPCRYEKGAWSECINGQMTREDKLKSTGGNEGRNDSNCETVRSINKKCNPSGGANKQRKERKNKGSRNRNQGQ
uniref:Pleiotrophin/Midkine C-terminal domain-containing protein n=1 Tax=Glossina palpalis gambiensis TaxID=67801 RepID=A0A1B0AUB7_9MUSC